MSDSEIAGYVATIIRLEAERDTAIARAERAEADADRLAWALHRAEDWEWHDDAVGNALAAHDALVAEEDQA